MTMTVTLEQPHSKRHQREARGPGSKRLPMIAQYLGEQQNLTAVERFSQLHETQAVPAQAKYYKALLPLAEPKAGQQYAFSVDLDRCTGCKACVTACHSLNGLDSEETWRSVGLLHGGSVEAPLQQTVTTACHHCLDPACMNGCPVNAYEKDARTGIVRHLDDQCIGCQYCTLTCPYEVPQFNKRLGIVRKCDMCSDRLEAGEAPACVQACPSEAIAIRIVDKAQVMQDARAGALLPGAPASSITQPSTEYKTRRALPANTLPADFDNIKPAHNHAPLVFMLVLTQLSVGAFTIDYLVDTLGDQSARRYHTLFALAVGLLALGSSTLHLGRPQYGFRAIANLRRSWMSREILCFGVFSAMAVGYALARWADPVLGLLGAPPLDPALRGGVERVLGAAVVASGVVGVLCSAQLYAITRRTWWKLWFSATKFVGTALVLGLGLTLSVLLATYQDGAFTRPRLTGLVLCLICASAAKLASEASIFLYLRQAAASDLKRTALLMRGALARMTLVRFVLGAAGGLLLPAALLVWLAPIEQTRPDPLALALAAIGFACAIGGELLERSLFFMAVAPPKMPGAVGK